MASGIFTVLDDIAALMDDVSVASKIATQKTAGILGDDLAVNAEKASGFLSSREIPVLMAITKGSFINKLIIIPIALLLNAFLPVLITLILVMGGFYLAYEGVEKIIAYLFHPKKIEHSVLQQETEEDALLAEKAKIKSAVFTDFILSIEIVIIALSTVLDQSLTIQILTLSVVVIVATLGVYGIVALIVRMDDLGFKLIKKSKDHGVLSTIGHFLVKALPVVIKLLAFVGTVALILVAGGIFTHQITYFHGLLNGIPSILKDALIGFLAGLLCFPLVWLGQKLLAKFRSKEEIS